MEGVCRLEGQRVHVKQGAVKDKALASAFSATATHFDDIVIIHFVHLAGLLITNDLHIIIDDHEGGGKAGG